MSMGFLSMSAVRRTGCPGYACRYVAIHSVGRVVGQTVFCGKFTGREQMADAFLVYLPFGWESWIGLAILFRLPSMP